MFGRTREARLAYRQRVLQTQVADLQRVTQMYLRPEQASIGVISNSNNAKAVKSLGLEERSI